MGWGELPPSPPRVCATDLLSSRVSDGFYCTPRGRGERIIARRATPQEERSNSWGEKSSGSQGKDGRAQRYAFANP